MKKILFGIFAHPDDEAFGPSATLIKEAEAGTDLHLVCVTCGEGGHNPDGDESLGAIRLKEWQQASAMIGAKKSYALNYQDGSLCNHSYHDLAEKLEAIIREVSEEQTESCELCLLTYDTNGISGHLDHIALSYITTYLFYRLKKNPPPQATVKELAYYCLSTEQMPRPNLDYFVFMPAGRSPMYINRSVNVRSLLARKYAVMQQHRSQRYDAEYLMALGDDFHAVDNFCVIT